jgi:hypothetical protein
LHSEGQSGLDAAAPTRVFVSGNAGNRVTLGVTGDLLRIDVAGEQLDNSLVACFREAMAAGAIRPNMLCLVDLSNFNGGIDWSAVHAMADLAPWGTEAGRASKTAYVTKSAWFSAMLKLTSVLFPKSQHRQFSGVHKAMQWLQEKSET